MIGPAVPVRPLDCSAVLCPLNPGFCGLCLGVMVILTHSHTRLLDWLESSRGPEGWSLSTEGAHRVQDACLSLPHFVTQADI